MAQETTETKSWFAHHKILTGVGVFILFIVFVNSIGGNKNTVTPPVNTAPIVSTKQLFEIPSLFNKNIDQIKKELGAPLDGFQTEPTKLQLQMGITEWNNSWKKDEETLLITYNPINRKVIDFFISGSGLFSSVSDKQKILDTGGLKIEQQNYKVEFVKMRKDPSQFTGVIVTPIL